MQAVAQQTGVPPDTLRSWERRHRFPVPVRNGSNRRLYSERDISAIHWLRDQTDRGQGIREAVAMLLSHLNRNATETPIVSSDTAFHPVDTRLESFIDALTSSRLDDAQRTWDQLGQSVSVEGLWSGILLPAYREIQDAYIDGALARHGLLRAHAFLCRKATVLGEPSICLATMVNGDDDVLALALATLLSRAGFHIVTPILHTASTDAIVTIRDVQPAMTIIVVGPDMDSRQLALVSKLLPEHAAIAVWAPSVQHDAPALPPGIMRLPSPLMDAVNTVRRQQR
jgi:DNA-binding transcriptional MerR regulator